VTDDFERRARAARDELLSCAQESTWSASTVRHKAARRRVARGATALSVVVCLGAVAFQAAAGSDTDAKVVASQPDGGEAAPPPDELATSTGGADQTPVETVRTSPSTGPSPSSSNSPTTSPTLSSSTTSTTGPAPPTCGTPSTRLGRGLWTVSPSGEAFLVHNPDYPNEQILRSTWSPDGEHLAYEIWLTGSSTSSLRVTDKKAQREMHPLDHNGSIWDLRWLDDEHLVLAVRDSAQSSAPRIISLHLNGTIKVLYEGTPGFVLVTAPAPDGRVFFLDAATSKIMVVNGDGTGLREIASEANWEGAGPVVSPDSRHVAAIVKGQRTIIDSDTGKQISLGPAGRNIRAWEVILGWSPNGKVVAFYFGGTKLYGLDGSTVDIVRDNERLGHVYFYPGDRLVFTTRDDGASPHNWEVAEVDGSGRRTLSGYGSGNVAPVSGAFVVGGWEDVGTGRQILCWSPLDGSASRPLVDTPVTDLIGSPAGSYLAVLNYAQ
jgi:hypothetical protein